MGKIDHGRSPASYPLRAAVEAEIERLIGLLDALDGDTDREDIDEDLEPDSDDEPWLSGFGLWSDLGDDRELDDGEFSQ